MYTECDFRLTPFATSAAVFARGSGAPLASYGPQLPNLGHHDGSMCRAAIYIGASTPGEAAASLASNLSGYDGRHKRNTRSMPETAQEEMAWMIDSYFSYHPDGTVWGGNYTPRGRKRRGLPAEQRRFFTLKPDGEPCWLYAMGVQYRGDAFKVTRHGITVCCRCKGLGTHSLTSVVWESPA